MCKVHNVGLRYIKITHVAEGLGNLLYVFQLRPQRGRKENK
jgi:hypothetical protein